MRVRARRLGAGLVSVVIAGWLAAVPGPAGAVPREPDPPSGPFARSTATTYQVTFAARACSSYTAVMANQVRDDATESPGRPGVDSAYRAGQQVDPVVEARVGCEPLTGAQFTLGSGKAKADGLSTVTGAGKPLATAAETPLLDTVGALTGGPISGAVTAMLSEEQVKLAARRQLWAQGGVPGAPVPGGHSFAVLRCAIDGRTGGNIQWIAFPSGVRHVFCFAYYVRGATATGTFTIKLRTTRPLGYPQRLAFSGSLSQAGSFALTADAAEASFVRLADQAYQIAPALPPGWRVAELTCAGSRIGADPATGRVDVTLAAGERASCSYAFEPAPAAAGLTIRAFSEGGAGVFGVTVTGGGVEHALTASPSGDGSAVAAVGADLAALPSGDYTITVQPPAVDAQLWSLSGAACNGTPVAVQGWALRVTVGGGASTDCVLRLARKQGSLTLSVVTVGDVATAGYAVVPSDGAAAGWASAATTSKVDTATLASGDLPTSVPFGSYLLTPVPPVSTTQAAWRLTGFGCQPGTSVGSDATVLKVDLGPSSPTVSCTATYQAVPAIRLGMTALVEGVHNPSSDVPIEVSCSDGSAGRAVLTANGTEPADLPRQLTFSERTTCTARLAAGAPQPSLSSAIVQPAPGNAPLALPATVVLDQPNTDYLLTITLRFGTDPDVDEERQGDGSGGLSVFPVLLIGSGLIGVAIALILVLVARRRINAG